MRNGYLVLRFWRTVASRAIFLPILLVVSGFMHAQLESMEDLEYPFEMEIQKLPDGKELAYAHFGQSGRDLVFIHGLASYAPAWLQQIAPLSEDYSLWVLDLPGFGKTKKKSSTVSLVEIASEVMMWANEKGLEEFILVGHSMGGQIALHCAEKYPDRVVGLILMAPAGFETFSTQEGAWLRSLYQPEVMAQADENQIRASYGLNFHRIPSSAEFMIQDRMNIRSAVDFDKYTQILSSAVHAMLDEPVFNLLPEISQPTLVFFGVKDQLIPNRVLHQVSTEDVARKGAEAMPNAHYLMIPEAGHFVQFEQAEKVNAEILNWLKTID